MRRGKRESAGKSVQERAEDVLSESRAKAGGREPNSGLEPRTLGSQPALKMDASPTEPRRCFSGSTFKSSQPKARLI